MWGLVRCVSVCVGLGWRFRKGCRYGDLFFFSSFLLSRFHTTYGNDRSWRKGVHLFQEKWRAELESNIRLKRQLIEVAMDCYSLLRPPASEKKSEFAEETGPQAQQPPTAKTSSTRQIDRGVPPPLMHSPAVRDERELVLLVTMVMTVAIEPGAAIELVLIHANRTFFARRAVVRILTPGSPFEVATALAAVCA